MNNKKSFFRKINKLFLILLSIAVLTSVVITSCQKEDDLENVQKDETTEEISDNYAFKNNRLIFKSIDSYESTLATISDNLTELEETNQNSLKKGLKSTKSDNDELYDEVLLAILSNDKTVQIGEWIVKVDMENEQVFVLNEKDIQYYNDLVNGVNNDAIYLFSTDDDVIEYLENNSLEENQLKSSNGLICRDDKAVAKSKSSYYLDGWRYAMVRYYKAGIYFSLYASLEDTFPTKTMQYNYNYKIVINYGFYDRCGRSYDRSWRSLSPIYGTFTEHHTFYKKRLYESSHNLSKYRLLTYFYGEGQYRFGLEIKDNW